MGFDFVIQLCFSLCSKTGKPFIYKLDTLEKDYKLPEIVIPEEYRRFLQMRGHFLHIYTDELNEDDMFSTDIQDLLEYFPSWKEITENPEYSEDLDDYWTEKDHDEFRVALEWFADQPYHFRASWSY